MKTTMKKITKIFLAVLVVTVLGAAFIAYRPGDASQSCHEYYDEMENPPAAALDWCKAGEYFSWESTLPVNADFEALNIFHVCRGNPANPAILMIHGYPTSSFDYADLVQAFSEDHYVCALYTPGYGFSDKPMDGYDYSIFDDARLVDEYIRDVADLDEFILYTHEKGDSVGWLSRDDMSVREGHAGPASETPGGQVLGKWEYDYAIIPHKGDWKAAQQYAYSFETSLRAIETDLLAGEIPKFGSFINHTPAEFVISSVKETEDGRGWLLRGYNIASETIKLQLKPGRKFTQAAQVNLAEDEISALKLGTDDSLDLPVSGHEIISILFCD